MLQQAVKVTALQQLSFKAGIYLALRRSPDPRSPAFAEDELRGGDSERIFEDVIFFTPLLPPRSGARSLFWRPRSQSGLSDVNKMVSKCALSHCCEFFNQQGFIVDIPVIEPEH